ncbi:hypothetical protein [Hyphomonas sp.]|uniref:hypothetical protein n=1 Tax=Hyphomonas sp. TaxID=87 RepID=UPI0025C312F2|nr:hypothetical protein [Hyphomonas sp.]
MAATHELTGLRRGNSFERLFRFKDSAGVVVDLTGSEIVFMAETAASTIRKTTADGTLLMPSPVSGEVTLKLTPAETRLFAVGRLRSRYEFERRIAGTEETLVRGCLVIEEGLNDDA